MKVDLLQLMTDLYTALGVQVLLLSSLSELGGQADYDFRRRLFKDFRYDNYIRSFCGDLEAGVLYHIEDDLRLFYSIFYVPVFSKTKYAGSYLFLGPVMFQSLTPDLFNRITAEKKIPSSMFNKVTEFYTKVPLFHSFDMWNAFAVILCSYLTDKNIKVRVLRYKDLQPKSIISDYIFAECSESSQNIIQARYEAETRLLNAVSCGNVKEALKAYNCVLQYRIPPRTADLLRNSKNMCIF